MTKYFFTGSMSLIEPEYSRESNHDICKAINLTLIFVLLLSSPAAFADDQEKAQKKALEQQAEEMIKEARALESSGQLLEARSRYAGSQAFWETKDATQAIKHIDEAIHNG